MKTTIVALLLAIAAVAHAATIDLPSDDYAQIYRPQLHFSPPRHWMNDPNGLVYLDGQYHLFYQHNPASSVWGPMHWGHAVSADLVHWRSRPVALHPDLNGAAFSGSVVYDSLNTSGLGSPGHPPLVAIFTSHDEARKHISGTNYQRQSLAYSLDKGVTWTQFADNPVLESPRSTDFRDPNVTWNARARKWIMALAAGDHVSFYSSDNLRDWRYESDFGAAQGAHGGVWECPDLIDMTAAGSSVPRYVLLVSVGQGAPNGGSGTQYFVGTFDGHAFKTDAFADESSGSPALWLDYGTDDYAGVTWSGIPSSDGRHLFIGWMSNWTYADAVPTQGWRGAMTLPRELNLLTTAAGARVASMPVRELQKLRSAKVELGRQLVTREIVLTRDLSPNSGLMEVELVVDPGHADSSTLVFDNVQHQATRFTINWREHRYELDRSASGATAFNEHFKKEQFAPMSGSEIQPISLTAYVDQSSIELFLNHGEIVMTSIDFPSPPYTSIRLRANQPVTLLSGAVFALQSIWPPREEGAHMAPGPTDP